MTPQQQTEEDQNDSLHLTYLVIFSHFKTDSHFPEKASYRKLGVHGFTLWSLVTAYLCRTETANGFIHATDLEVCSVQFKDLDLVQGIEALKSAGFATTTEDGLILTNFSLDDHKEAPVKAAQSVPSKAGQRTYKERSPVNRTVEDRGPEYKAVWQECYAAYPKKADDIPLYAEAAFQTEVATVEQGREVLLGVKEYAKGLKDPQYAYYFHNFMTAGHYRQWIREAKGEPLVDIPASENGFEVKIAFDTCWDGFLAKHRGDKKKGFEAFVAQIKTQEQADAFYAKIEELNSSLSNGFGGHTFAHFVDSYESWEARNNPESKKKGFHKAKKSKDPNASSYEHKF